MPICPRPHTHYLFTCELNNLQYAAFVVNTIIDFAVDFLF